VRETRRAVSGGDDENSGSSSASQSMSSGSGISLTIGGDNVKALWLPFRAEGEDVKLLSASERLGVAMLSSSSIVLYLYGSESLEGKLLVLRRSRS
jgi:hypothetical protein